MTLTAPPLPRLPRVPRESWWSQLQASSKVSAVVVAALLGTGGCAGLLTGTAAVMGALKPDLKPVVERLDRHEQKLDEIREDQLGDKARLGSQERKQSELESRQRALEEEVESYRKQLRER